jgi:hypothetical protein
MLKVDDKGINFGDYTWLVLKLEPNRMLVITENIIELRWHHTKFEDITWADCALRKYLNSEFYDSFDKNEKKNPRGHL